MKRPEKEDKGRGKKRNMIAQTVRFHSFWTPFCAPFSHTVHRLPVLAPSSSIKATMQSEASPSELKMDAKSAPQRWLFVGLGNPGSKYQGTRHNVGFEMIDTIARVEAIKINTIQCKALLGKGHIGDAVVLLAKPQTYVNLSGESVGPLAKYYKIPVENILVIYDDLDLEVAMMRLLPKGGHGGHNGMKSVIQNLKGSRLFPRLRIGIGRPPGTMDPKAYVLQKFSKPEREEIDFCLDRGVEAARLLSTQGIEKAISTWNPPRKRRDPTFNCSSNEA